jgi:hypothetical protein
VRPSPVPITGKFTIPCQALVLAKNLKSMLVAGTFGLSALLPGNANAAPGQIKIGSYPIGVTNSQGVVTWAPDGTTEYEVQIRADSTDIPTNVIQGVDWHFTLDPRLTNYIQFTKSSLPDPINNPSKNTNDFFMIKQWLEK